MAVGRKASGASGVLAAALAVAACGGNSGDSDPPAATSPGQGTGTSSAPASVTAIPVTATEMSLTLGSDAPTPGSYTFTVNNAGRAPHALAIKGPGVAMATTKTINGGEQAQLTVTLQRGSYDLWCPVGQHRELGMQRTLTVP